MKVCGHDDRRAQPAATAQRLDGARFEFEVASSAWLTSYRWAKAEMNPRPSVVGPLITALISLWVGVRLLLTGRGGYRAGFSEGAHIRIGGAVLVILGVWMLAVAISLRQVRRLEP